MSDFATILTNRRKELGLSQGELAKRLHVTRQAVSKWENGKGIPDIDILTNMSEVLGMSTDELLKGKEPEKQVVERVVEKEVIREVEKEVIKEVTKPMPFRKILAIVAPIVLVIVLASALMGVYIPKALEKPPVEIEVPVGPAPEIKYTEVYIKGKSNTDDSFFNAPLIGDKAYYVLEMQCSSDYTLYITAPKGAVATLSGEVIAEFDTAKTVEYSQYFKTSSFVKDPNYVEKPNNRYEYKLNGELITDGVASINYRLVIDMTDCSEEDKQDWNQYIVIRQHYGFDNVVVPAGSTYFVALRTQDKADAWHYVIKSEGIRYVETCILHSSHNYDLDWTSGQSHPRNPVSDFYIEDYKGAVYWGKDCDFQIGLINETDHDIKLEIEEIGIEEIYLGQEVTVKNIPPFCEIIFKINITKHRYLLSEVRYYSHSMLTLFCDDNHSIGQINYESYRKGWEISEDKYISKPGWLYVRLVSYDDEVSFVIHDAVEYGVQHGNADNADTQE